MPMSSVFNGAHVVATNRARLRLNQAHGTTPTVGTCLTQGKLQPVVVEYRKQRNAKGRLVHKTIVVNLAEPMPFADVPAFMDALTQSDIDAAYAAAGVAPA
ncbi:hypothetical protein D3C87_848040 [compost metagenome]